MKPVRIFRHVDCEGPGYLLDVLQKHNIGYELVAIDAGDEVPEQIDDVSGLVFMGGGMSVNDPLPWIKKELGLIRRAHTIGLPVMGICLGAQLICRALGGDVSPGLHKEVGWGQVHKSEAGEKLDWFNTLPDQFVAFHWHGEMFSIPQGATRLLANACCENQAFAIGHTLALQFHLEMKADVITEWIERFYSEVDDGGPCVQPAEEIISQCRDSIPAMNSVADDVFAHWLKYLASDNS